MNALEKNLGAHIALRASLGPVAGTGAAQNGGWVERRGFQSCVVAVPWSTSGGVTGGAVKVKLQDANDASGTGAADYTTEETFNIPAGPNAGGVAKHSVDLGGARAYVRAVVDSDPTGGTPASIVGALLILGSADKLPAV